MLKRVLITAGGTGGHIYPAIAIAEEFQKRGAEVLYVGNINSLEEKVVKLRGFNFRGIDVQKLYREFTIKHLAFPFKLLKSIMMANSIIKEFKPDLCIGCGGFVSGPVIIRAAQLKIPYYLLEQNSFPGLTTRKLSKGAKRVFLGYESAQKYLPNSKWEYTGNPLLLDIDKVKDRSLATKDSNQPLLLFILGGSQGASFINNIVLKNINLLLDKGLKIVWQTGNYQFTEIEERLKAIPKINASVEIFPYTHNITSIYQSADLAICRAGALTLAELEAYKIPAIIIPLPSSAGDHQYHNALHQQEQLKGLLLEQNENTEQKLLESLDLLLRDYDNFQKHLTHSVHAKATETIVDRIYENQAKDSKRDL
ncbi:MAG: undecaprenyldiphospho-muramoylpentapeptide beta-N-acetylglucosaminyltransferase [Candidatus Cloacimonadia bacterium]